MLHAPRCGVKWSQTSRQKRFAILNGWKTHKSPSNETIVTWYMDLSNYGQINTKIESEKIERVFATALNKWSETALLRFDRVYSEEESNITIKFYFLFQKITETILILVVKVRCWLMLFFQTLV
jgi:hypothetical protein